MLDTPPEERFDRITRTAAHMFGVPIALVTLVDEERQWFKSCQGVSITETPRNVSFCAYAILGTDVMVVPDARLDPRFADNPLVTGEPFLRFYAGYPLAAANGSRPGTLCVLDTTPRTFSAEDRQLLRDLAAWAERELNTPEMQQVLAAQRASEIRMQAVLSSVFDGMITAEAQGRIASFAQAAEHIFAYHASGVAAAAQAETPATLQASTDTAPRPPLRILLVEDNPVNQKLTLRLLDRLGYGADVADNGQAALDALARQPYDVVLMDIQMPQMDGIEATTRIRQHRTAPQPAIVALTASALPGDRERFLSAGMDDYLSKPVRLQELAAVLERCTLSAEAAPQPTTSAPQPTPAPPPIDPAAFENLREAMGEDDPDALRDVIEIFLDNTHTLLGEMRQAAARRDTETLRRLAHSLKSSSASVGALTLSDYCAAIEARCRAHVLDDIDHLLILSEAEQGRVKEALQVLRVI
jgi:CheY-like chemotaxis protein/HPt (histidine-containing phosphotransfer) domain-containing protein